MITSRNNRWLKDIRHLRTSKGRRRDPRLVLEGPHLVKEALDEDLELDAILATEAFLDSPAASPILATLPRPPLVVEAHLLDEVADADSPRGLIAIGHRPQREIPVTERGIYVYADGLQDPGNLGALARVAEGAGAEGLFLGAGTVSPHHPRALRASAGSLLRLPFTVDASPEDVSRRLEGRERWFKLVARHGQDLYAPAPVPGPAGASAEIRVLAIGAEGRGLSSEVDQRAGDAVTIPMAGRVESLNATVSAAIVLFEWRRQQASGAAG